MDSASGSWETMLGKSHKLASSPLALFLTNKYWLLSSTMINTLAFSCRAALVTVLSGNDDGAHRSSKSCTETFRGSGAQTLHLTSVMFVSILRFGSDWASDSFSLVGIDSHSCAIVFEMHVDLTGQVVHLGDVGVQTVDPKSMYVNYFNLSI